MSLGSSLDGRELTGTVRSTAAPLHLSTVIARLVAAEFVVIAAAAYGASAIYSRLILLGWPPVEQYVSGAVSIAVLAVLVSLGFHHFTSIQTMPRHKFLWNGIGAVMLAFSLFLTIIFLVKQADGYSRGTFLFQFMAVSIAILGMRTLSHARMQKAIATGRIEARRTILIGDELEASQLAARMRQVGILTVGSFAFPESNDVADGGAGDPYARKMIEQCRALRPDDILILTAPDRWTRIASMADVLSELPASIHIVPAGAGDLLVSSHPAEIGSVMTIQVVHSPLSFFDRGVKRVFDIVTASVGLIVLLPLFLVVSIAIRLESRGPILFRQSRHGYNNDTIRVFKFRSMNVTEDGDQFRQARKGDLRITAVGRMLRRTNIDELPQLLNVLMGEMSMVGPRPHAVAHNRQFETQILPFSRRHNVKPGITGWAQVNGHRGETDTIEKMQRRFEHDLYYIQNWSFMLDLKIIVMTVFSKSAYLNAR